MKAFLLIVLLTLTYFSAFAQNTQNLSNEIIGVTQELPGLVEVNGTNLKGLAIDRVRAVLKKLKIKENIQVYPWARSYELTKRYKNYFIFPIAKNPEREKFFRFAGVIFNVKTFIYVRENSPIKIKKLEEAKKYSICLVREDVRDIYLRSNGYENLVRFVDQETAMHGLIAKKCDIGIIAENIETLWKNKNKSDINKFVKKIMNVKEIDGERYIAFNKDVDEETFKKFAKAIKDVTK